MALELIFIKTLQQSFKDKPLCEVAWRTINFKYSKGVNLELERLQKPIFCQSLLTSLLELFRYVM